jgi:DNA-binding response OmpR family regulator
MAKKIYVLEDDAAIREVIELILSLELYEVESFSSVTEFWSADHHQVDLYLLDVNLTDGNGLNVCRELKVIQGRGTPLLMMSAHADLTNVRQEYAAEDFLTKPFDISVLLDKVRSRLYSDSLLHDDHVYKTF